MGQFADHQHHGNIVDFDLNAEAAQSLYGSSMQGRDHDGGDAVEVVGLENRKEWRSAAMGGRRIVEHIELADHQERHSSPKQP